MSFASAFGPQAARASAIRQLVPGVVIKIFAKMDDGKIQEKRHVVIGVTATEVITCVINTELSNFVQSKPHLLMCQIPIFKTGNSFLTRDSHLDCSLGRKYPREVVVGQLTENPHWILGVADDPLLSDMIVAINNSIIIAPEDAQSYCDTLNNAKSSTPIFSLAPAAPNSFAQLTAPPSPAIPVAALAPEPSAPDASTPLPTSGPA